MSLKDEFEKLKLKIPVVEEKQNVDPEDVEESDYEEVEGFNLLILTSSTDSQNRKSRKNPTVVKLEEYCNSNEIPFYTAFADTAVLEKVEGEIKIHNVGDEEGYTLDRDKTIIVARRGVMFHKYSQNLMTRLEKYRFCFLNEIEAIRTCEDKYLTMLELIEAKLPIPKSSLVPTEDMIDFAHQKIGGEWPVVCKALSGTQGVGVFVINDYKSLKSTLQTIWGLGSGTEIMLQEYIESDHDVRIHVLGDKVLAAMKRSVVENDFRSNVHLGAETSKYKVPKDIEKLAIKAAKALKCGWCGVDIMFDKEGNPYVLEVNSSAGTDGVESVNDINIVEHVIKYLKNGLNWRKPAQEVGSIETMEIEGIGELIARFDTGNSSKSISLDAQNIEVKGDTVKWITNKQEMSAEKIKDVRMKYQDGSDSKAQPRPVVGLTVTFNGVVYENVPFNLNDRSHKTTPVLINKEFMIRSGSVVNPGRLYMVTDKPKVDKRKEKKRKDKEEREEN